MAEVLDTLAQRNLAVLALPSGDLATLVKRLRAARPQALLLDGGDSWQGSASALWTRGADMIGAQKRLGVEFMTAHWEFTYGAERLLEAVKGELAPIELLAQNVRTLDFEEPVFKAYALRPVSGVPVAIIGQAFPYTPIANPRYMVPDWTFGIQDARLQKMVDETRAKGAPGGGAAVAQRPDVHRPRRARHRRHPWRPPTMQSPPARSERRWYQRRLERKVPRRASTSRWAIRA